jgi:hypothetical protein
MGRLRAEQETAGQLAAAAELEARFRQRCRDVMALDAADVVRELAAPSGWRPLLASPASERIARELGVIA